MDLDTDNGRLAGWKSELLKRADRVALAKSIITSMPVYPVQNMWLPTCVCDQIDRSVRQFIWGSKSNHWVKWYTVTLRNQDGLCIHSARATNISLVGKDVWNSTHNPNNLWVQLLTNLLPNYFQELIHYSEQQSNHLLQSCNQVTN